jgi:DNA-binding transcriptional LysR family regulator
VVRGILVRPEDPDDVGERPARSGKEIVTTADVTLRQLRYFVVLSEELNYRRAAERLFLTQPALSTAIKHLEHQFDVELFIRNTRGVLLSDVGRQWLPRVHDVLASVDMAVEHLVSLAGSSGGRLRVGYLIGTGADLLFRLIRQFESAHPEMSIEATEFDFSDPTAGLSDSTSDVALIRPPVQLPGHSMVTLDAESWVTCLPLDHRLAGRESVDIGELLDDPIICAPESAGIWRDYWLATENRGGRAPVIGGVAATYESEMTMVSRGLGISFTTESSARLYDRPGITYVPITGRPPSYVALAWDPQKLNRAGEALVRLACEDADEDACLRTPDLDYSSI